jgi:hypothetical protein
MKLSDNFFRSSKSSREQQVLCQRCLENIFAQFGNSETSIVTIEKFAMAEEARHSHTIFSWRIGNKLNAFTLALVEYDIEYINARKTRASVATASHLYLFGHLELNKDYGVSYIRPESLKDKVLEMFVPVEIDFPEAPEFSSKYYVLSNDKEKFANAVSPSLMRYLLEVEGLEIEFRNNECLFRFEGVVEEEKSLQLCEVGLNLDRLLNHS